MSERSEVEELGDRIGFGQLMFLASEIWKEKDPTGYLTVGPCGGLVPGVHTTAKMKEAAATLAKTAGRTFDVGPVARTPEIELARSLHRVWRALNDGDCPKCHRHVAATEIRRLADGGLMCPTLECSFVVTGEEIDLIERMFAPAMDACVAAFEKWRADRGAGYLVYEKPK